MSERLRIISMLIVAAGIISLAPRTVGAVLYEVEIENFSYNPSGLHINPGDMVEWRNRDAVFHSATSDNGVWDSGLLAEDDTYTYTFSLAGVFPYHCTVHPSMMDTIVVGNPTDVNDQSSSLPDRFEVSQNYPNPFNAQTEIEYSLPRESHVRIEIYNLLGQNVETLVDDTRQAGYHQVVWDATNVPTGVYFYRIAAGDFTQTRKMLLMK